MEEKDLFDGWDSPTSDADLFSVEDSKKETPTIEEEFQEAIDKKEVEQEEDFFDSPFENEVDTEKEGTNGPEISDPIIKKLVEGGYVEGFEEGKNFDDYLDAIVSDKLAKVIENLPEDNKDLLDYLVKGGDVTSYLSNLNALAPTEISSDMDIEDEKIQKLVVTKYLKDKGFTEDTIKDQLEYFKDSDKLEGLAKKEFDTFLKKQKEAEVKALEDIRQRKIRAQEEELQNINNVDNILKGKTSIGYVDVPYSVKKELPSYMFKKSVELNNGVTISEMQQELFYELPKSHEAMIQLAVMLRNRNADGTFNLEKIAKKLETKVTKKVKDNLRRNPNEENKTVKHTGYLADLFK